MTWDPLLTSWETGKVNIIRPGSRTQFFIWVWCRETQVVTFWGKAAKATVIHDKDLGSHDPLTTC